MLIIVHIGLYSPQSQYHTLTLNLFITLYPFNSSSFSEKKKINNQIKFIFFSPFFFLFQHYYVRDRHKQAPRGDYCRCE